MVGVQPLEGADRLAVVTELPVVVVLQDESPGGTRPVDGGGAAVGVQRDAGGELVGGGEEGRAYVVEAGQLLGAGAAFIDEERDGAQARAGDDGAVEVEAVRLDGQPPGAQRAAEQGQPLHESGADDDAAGVGAYAAGAGEVVGEDGAQFGAAVGGGVAEGLAGGGGQRAAGGGQPGGAGEGGDVGGARGEVEARPVGAAGRAGGARGGGRGARQHPLGDAGA
ncbi:hypothetical protein AB0K49_02160 [Streptomyces decoyicus]|uniref:hypothetical protein n=1 Tax=Streptomyces decoyicus TaxID=249567 RepID=UPI00345C73D1